ncbi:sushi, von Willebrand factor type A, EGF and pentraxin domain-containing protein 1-like isoform X2 [Ostrea edulis]|uniref:sushi, von Willebrand factor type A, EGF and pentraxin domain-containing protein 1-like isoform X2 n=1 Tax=Ostrea edulis TaxID=37623 RepID=UPI0024AF5FA4|nr:sushi, von Willebrand factor type A, EGF and pentraxin domain-containing protein 1-like isoform X2 [Ostrea edulis]XP_055995641.1 sushi, von Willebrand factor type A, EGF and pentraxin domain-containing protein 1-like isoform X2 [Ostrea edulis]
MMKRIKELLCLFAIYVFQVRSIDERGCKGLMELVVIIDGSDSINKPDYDSLKISMSKLVQKLDIQETEIRISFIVFSSDIALETPLMGDKQHALNTAATLPHPRDGTKTWMALEAMTRVVAKKREVEVPIVGVVLTDGISKDEAKTRNAAKLLKDSGVNLYAIGVTDIKNKQELKDIASKPENVITFQTFSELADKLESLVKLVCPKCPPNPLLAHSDTQQADYIVDTLLEYHCKPDYVPVGNNTIKCQRDLTWTKLDYACLSDCGDPPILEHTMLEMPGRLEGSSTKYTCTRGSVLEGTPETVCKEDGTWSKPTFKCRADCGLPNIIKHTTLSPGGNLEGDLRTYTCASTTVQEGNPSIECLHNGQWSKTDLYCRPICGEPPVIERATISVGGIVEGATRTYTCNANTATEGNTIITCGADGRWSLLNLYCRPDCGPPPQVERAVIKEYNVVLEGVRLPATLEGVTRYYECQSNTVAEGLVSTTCQLNGKWSTTGLYCRPNCGHPPTIERSTVSFEGTLETHTATYTCSKNTVTEGITSITCQIDGSWSSTNLFCRPDCGPPPEIERSMISVGKTLQGITRTYTCQTNTVTEGTPTTTCEMNGQWSKTNLYCRPDCGLPPQVERAVIKEYNVVLEGVRLPATLEGVTRYYECQSNTVAEGLISTTCQVNGKWSTTGLYCRPDCDIPSTIDRSTVTYQGTLEGQIASYTCAQNTRTEGITDITCQNDGTWSSTTLFCRPNCGPPPIVLRAKISEGDTYQGTTRKYSCLSNTVKEGIPTITCGMDGQWSKTKLYCRPNCGEPMKIERATIDQGSTLEGSVRTYTCDMKTVTEGETKIACLESGVWSDTSLYCRPDCGDPPHIDRALVDIGKTVEGVIRTYTCQDKTVTEGSTKIRCEKSGVWSTSRLYCRPDCGPPPVVRRSTISVGNTLQGTVRLYNCDQNTVTEGHTSIECQIDGTWSQTDLYCRPDCGDPDHIPRATISVGSNLEGSTRMYTCNENTRTEGITSISCTDTGTWSQTNLYCRPNCGEPPSVLRATINPGGTHEGDRRAYLCNQQTVTEGNTEIYCQTNGQWSSTNLYCRPDCLKPPRIDRAALSVGRTVEGTIRTYTCNPGTHTEGTTTIRCQESGVWSATNLYCRPDCGNPPTVARSSISIGDNLEGTTRYYTCVDKAVAEGLTQTTCQIDGTWSITNLYCRPDCGIPMNILRATISPGDTLEGTVRTYTCNSNTATEGATESICQINGQWSLTAEDLYCRPDCGEPLSIERATIAAGSNLEGSTRHYICSANTVAQGQLSITCQNDGTWSMTDLYCRPNCGIPENIPRGAVQFDSTLEGAVATYTCAQNTVLEGGATSVCQRNGNWSAITTYCRPNCREPLEILRATVSVGSTLEGASRTYTCNTRTVAESGPAEIVCQKNGMWSTTDLYCRPDCGAPQLIVRATISAGNNLEGSIRTYTCDANTLTQGIINIRCQLNGQWTSTDLYCRPQCGRPPLIERASFYANSTAEGGVTQYTCSNRTVTEGSTTIVCQNDGTWSYTDLYCRPNCGPPPNIPRSTLQPGGTTEGSSRFYVCDQSTITEGITETKCLKDGTWSKTDMYCRPDCGAPVFVENSKKIYPTSTAEGTRLILECVEGTVPEGSNEVFCQKDGTWTKPTLYCRPDCKKPMMVPRATAQYTSTLEGAVVVYVCNAGTVSEGENSILCKHDGTWTDTNLYCRPECGPPPTIQRATFSAGNWTEGSTLTYMCQEHTVMEGNPSIACQSNGLWSDTSLYCRPDCGLPKLIHRAVLSEGDTVEGVIRTYTCIPNTVPEGETTIVCQNNGLWSLTDLYCRPNCGEPPVVDRAVVDVNGSTLESATRYYKCTGDSVLEGDYSITCEQNGRWSDISFYCRPNCGQPNPMLRATVDISTGTLEGSIALYRCDQSTVQEGFGETVCQKDGHWSSVDFYCRPDCRAPPKIPRATLQDGFTTEGSLRFYVCDKNTHKEGRAETSCQSDGTWTPIDLYCRPDCGMPPHLPNTFIAAPGPTTEGSEVVYGCVENHVAEGEPSIFCRKDGTWTNSSLYCRPDCGMPALPPRVLPIPDDAYTLEGSVITMQCEDDNEPEGDDTIKCGPDGRWTVSNFYCRPDCGPPKQIQRTTIKGLEGGTLEGTTIMYICDDNTDPSGNPSSVCTEYGIWSNVTIKCTPNCGRPSDVPRATIREGPTTEGTVRIYDCKPGTQPEGDNTITCQSNGLWTRTNLYCRPDCGQPRKIERATISDGGTLEGSVRTYTCDAKSKAEGNIVTTCRKDRTWTPINLYCRPDCGKPPPIARATVRPGDTTEGSVRTYICDADTKATGDHTITCQKSGQWTIATLNCEISVVVPPDPDLPPGIDVCDGCDMRNGVGFAPHPGDCYRFVQCYFGANGEIRSAIRKCPYGQYWDQRSLTCQLSVKVTCKNENCRIPTLKSYAMNHVKNCRAYWKCILGKSYGMCCPEGKRYKPYVGCITDPKCDDACPPLTAGLGACDNRMIFGDPNHFEQFVPGMGWIKMPCPLGTQYNAVDCGCTTHGPSPNPDKVCRPEVYLPFDKDTEDKSGNNVHIQNNNVSVVEGVAYFNGEAELIIPRFSNFEYTELVVAFTYLETPPCQEVTALISNSDCCTSTPTMAIVKSYKNVHFLAKCNGGLVTTFKLPLHLGNWNKVFYIHDTERLEGRVNGLENSKWAVGQIQKTHTAIHIGYGRGFRNFKGYMDDVTFYLCRPKYI